jgi:hypothetical protein
LHSGSALAFQARGGSSILPTCLKSIKGCKSFVESKRLCLNSNTIFFLMMQ